MYLNDVFTVTVNLAGLPGISVPAGVIARACRSAAADRQGAGRGTLFSLGRALEQAAAFTAKPERWW
jgi:aspartyl-tRNA(Asn)/glutamyl-tRNA(Gln) amidotransferase subunit A